MKPTEEAIEAAWQKHRGEEEYDPGYPVKASSNFTDGFRAGAEWALSNQWVSVEDNGLPKPKDYDYTLTPSIDDDRPTIYVYSNFLIIVRDNDGSGYDFCEANFKVLPDGIFQWVILDDIITSRFDDLTVTHWMPIPPPPEK